MSICEVTLKTFKKSHFLTYRSYCSVFASSLVEGNLSKAEETTLLKIMDELDYIFSIPTDEAGKIISDYFILKKYLIFEKPVLLAQEFFLSK